MSLNIRQIEDFLNEWPLDECNSGRAAFCILPLPEHCYLGLTDLDTGQRSSWMLTDKFAQELGRSLLALGTLNSVRSQAGGKS